MDWVFVHKTWDKWASINIGSGEQLLLYLLLSEAHIQYTIHYETPTPRIQGDISNNLKNK